MGEPTLGMVTVVVDSFPVYECTENTVCCSDSQECTDMQQSGREVSCTGYASCKKNSYPDLCMDLTAEDYIDCDAVSSCASACLDAAVVNCRGDKSCRSEGDDYSTITASDTVNCAGTEACSDVTSITAANIMCYGLFSCTMDYTPFPMSTTTGAPYTGSYMVATEQIGCRGDRACAQNTMTSPWFECSGLSSCEKTEMRAQRVMC